MAAAAALASKTPEPNLRVQNGPLTCCTVVFSLLIILAGDTALCGQLLRNAATTPAASAEAAEVPRLGGNPPDVSANWLGVHRSGFWLASLLPGPGPSDE